MTARSVNSGQRASSATAVVLLGHVCFAVAVAIGRGGGVAAFWPSVVTMMAFAWAWRATRETSESWPWTVVALAYWMLGYLQIGTLDLGRPMHDETLLLWEQRWFGDPAHAWSARWPQPALSVLLNGCYVAFYGVVLVPLLLLWRQRRWRALEVTTFAFTLTLVLGYTCFTLWPVEGPRYRAPLAASALPDAAHGLASWLLATFSSRGTAFPSSHTSLAVVQCVLAWRFQRRVAYAIVPITVGVGLGAVYGGFHYLVDVCAGAVLGAVIGGVCLARWREAREPRESRGNSPGASSLLLAAGLFVTGLFVATPAHAQSGRDTTAFPLYRGLPYGSQALVSPLTVLLNKGFDHFQARNARRDVWTFPYRASFSNVIVDAVRRPGAAIARDPGLRTWLRTEVLPLSFNTRDAAWVVNYSEHLVAGGLTYRAMDVWYAQHGVRWPRAWAATTTLAAAALNEMAEFPTASRVAASTVADLLLFDVGGVLLFSWNPITRLFADRLQAADWSQQATFTAPDGAVRNNGQYFTYRVPLPRSTQWRAFLRAGMGVQGGLSRTVGNGYAITGALGADTEVRRVDPVTARESIVLRPGGGIYVDRHRSLLASLTAGPSVQRYTLNVYPGVLPGTLRDLGVWTAVTHDGQWIGGVVHRRALGVGVGHAP